MADLRPDRYRETEIALIHLVARRIAPTLGRMARLWNAAHGSPTYQLERVAALLDAVARAGAAGSTPQHLALALSHALEPLLPHDRFELLLGDPAGTRYYRLGEHAGGPPWSDPSLVLKRLLDPDRTGRRTAASSWRMVRPALASRYFTAADRRERLRAVVGQWPGRRGPGLVAQRAVSGRTGATAGRRSSRVGLWWRPVGAAGGRARARETGRQAAIAGGSEVARLLALGADPRNHPEVAETAYDFSLRRDAPRPAEQATGWCCSTRRAPRLPDPSTPVGRTGWPGVRATVYLLRWRGEARLIVRLVAGRCRPGAHRGAPSGVVSPRRTDQRLADVVPPPELLRARSPQPFGRAGGGKNNLPQNSMLTRSTRSAPIVA
jgi:hypothetical protein